MSDHDLVRLRATLGLPMMHVHLGETLELILDRPLGRALPEELREAARELRGA